MNHTGGTELAVQFRIFALEAFIAQIDLMLFALVAAFFFFVFGAAAHYRTPCRGLSVDDQSPDSPFEYFLFY
jgi:hypothetical protein